MANLNLNAQSALAELRALIIEVNNLKKELSDIKGTNSDSFIRLDESSKKLKSQIGLLANKMNYLKSILDKQNKEINQNTTSTNINTTATKNNNTQKSQAVRANKTLSDSYRKLIGLFGLLGGTALFINILKETYETIKTFDSLGFALERITETTQDYESSQRFLLQLTRDFGVELVTTTNRWIKFLAASKNAGLSLYDTEKIFRSMTKAASVLGLKTDELQGIYLALEQMLSKGKVTTEELRRQLGERLPGAMGIMAASIGVTIPELDKMLRRGEVLSAEVLPNFADAVELAYGIDTVNKVSTLVSEQNRLTASFQIFVKNITEGDSIIKKSLTTILTTFSDFIDSVNWIFSTDDQRERNRISKQYEYERKEMEKSFDRFLDAQREGSKQTVAAKIKIKAALEKLENTSNKKERDALKAHIDDMQALIVSNGKEAQAAMITKAREDITIIKSSFDQIKALRKKGNLAADLAEEEGFGQFTDFQKSLRGSAIEQKRNEAFLKATGISVNDLGDQYVVLAAKYDLYRKLIDDSDVTVINDGNEGLKQREKILENIVNLEKEKQIQIAKTSIENNDSKINSDNTSFSEKIALEKANSVLLNKIAETQFKIDREKAEEFLKKKNQDLEKNLKDGVKIIGDVEKYKEDLQTNFNNKIIIAEEEKNAKIVSNNENASNKILKIIEEVNKARLDGIQDPFNLEMIAVKKNYELSKKTNKDRQNLEKQLKKIAVESANAQIDAQISLLKAQLLVEDQSVDAINAIIRKINELEAAKKSLVKDDNVDASKFWFDILGLASDYNAAIGDLVDAGYNRKIENINAEIEAEKQKYDELIRLAEGDDLQQKTLQRNKEERIKALEEKRLKEEQKRAKARKAFAIADIGISTAQAIMRAYSDTGPISGTIFAALIAGLGAVQIAAVLAQPIPQYKDGGNIKKNELAMINDGVSKEYVERNGSILSTDTKNALVDLKAGDIVYKDYDTMVNKSSLIPKGISEVGFGESEFNKLYFGIQSSIEKGFKKAKIKNNINMSIKDSNDSYRDKLSRWN